MFLFLSLISIATANTIIFTDAAITLTTISSGPIDHPSSVQDYCGKIIAINSSVHHVNTLGVYQNWLKGALLNHIAFETVSLTSIVEDYSVSHNEQNAAIIEFDPILPSLTRTTHYLNSSLHVFASTIDP